MRTQARHLIQQALPLAPLTALPLARSRFTARSWRHACLPTMATSHGIPQRRLECMVLFQHIITHSEQLGQGAFLGWDGGCAFCTQSKPSGTSSHAHVRGNGKLSKSGERIARKLCLLWTTKCSLSAIATMLIARLARPSRRLKSEGFSQLTQRSKAWAPAQGPERAPTQCF